jgi:hypothetical protein
VAAVDGRLWVESPAGGPTLLTIQLPWTPSRAGNPYAAPAHIQPNQPVQNNQPDQNSQEASR